MEHLNEGRKVADRKNVAKTWSQPIWAIGFPCGVRGVESFPFPPPIAKLSWANSKPSSPKPRDLLSRSVTFCQVMLRASSNPWKT